MLLHSPLSVVTPSVDGDVLTALAAAEDEFTLSRLHSLAPHRSRDGLRRALARLSDQGIVDVRAVGTSHAYSLNREHLASPSILELTAMKSRFLERVHGELVQWTPPPIFAAMFGSAPRGAMETSSDIDLFLLHPGEDAEEWGEVLDELSRRAQRWTGNAVNILTMTVREVHGAGVAEPVLRDVSRDGIPILGTPRDFRRLIGESR